MSAAVAVARECPLWLGNAHLQGLSLMRQDHSPGNPPVLCRHPSSLHTLEFIPVPAQACLQHLGSAFPQLKLTQVTLALLGPHPHQGNCLLETEVPWCPWPSSLPI